MKINPVILVIGFVAMIVWGIWGFYLGQTQQLRNMREAYKTCLVAYHEINGESEQACGDAQDATSTEFICNQARNCWLEVK